MSYPPRRASDASAGDAPSPDPVANLSQGNAFITPLSGSAGLVFSTYLGGSPPPPDPISFTIDSPGSVTTCVYDGRGRLVASPGGGTRTTYVYDGGSPKPAPEVGADPGAF